MIEAKKTSSILVVEDHAMVLEALCAYIGRDLHFLPTGCRSKSKALSLIEQNGSYDLILLDMHLPDAVNIRDHAEIVDANENKPVILLSSEANRIDVNVAIKLGMAGYISKQTPASKLVQSIRDVLEGKIFQDGVIGSAFQPTGVEILNSELSDHESRVLQLMKLGLSNAKIANKLNDRHAHVQKTVSEIYKKIGVRTRLQAVTKMFE